MTTKINPFEITKASDFTDNQIHDYWVNYPGLSDIVSPTSSMSKFILGGKGSGKTHILRYHSFNNQKIRFKEKKIPLVKGIQKDKYIGFYLNCENLSSGRFKNKGKSNEEWVEIFKIFVELWIASRIISVLSELLQDNEEFKEKEEDIVKELLSITSLRKNSNDQNSLNFVISKIENLQKDLDYHVRKSIFDNDLKINDELLKISNSSLIYGIPRVIQKNLSFLNNVIFLVILDEIENFTKEQQIYINTLIRDKKPYISFRIGGRLYGIRTHETINELEVNKKGSEYDVDIIDDIARSKSKPFETFLIQLFNKRLVNSGYVQFNESNIESIKGYFEEFSESQIKKSLKSLDTESKNRPYFQKLIKQLTNLKRYNDSQINEIIQNLNVEDHILLERINISLFYQDWKSGKDLLESSKEISIDTKNHLEKKENNRLKKKLKRSKTDTLSKIYKECQTFQRYTGLDTIIHLSDGLPRNFLIIMKNIFKWSEFSNENPFIQGNKISEFSQRKGILEAAEWFYEDARDPSEYGITIRNSINNICELLKTFRFSDAGSIDSLKSFSLDEPDQVVIQLLEQSKQWSLIVSRPITKKSKNASLINYKFEINSLLCPLWDLPVQSGGCLNIKNSDAKIIFTHSNDSKFTNLLRIVNSELNPPFSKKNKNNESSLFQGVF
jgi:hypothetical protein